MKDYIRKIKGKILIQVLSNIVATIAIAVIPYLTKLLFDRKFNDFKILIGVYILCVVAHLAFSYIEAIYSWKGNIEFEKLLKKDFFKVVASYSYKRFKSKEIGEYISLQANEINQFEMDYLTPLIDLIKSINIFIVYGVMLFIFVDWKISLVILALSILSVAVGPNLTSKKISKRRGLYLNKLAEYTVKVQDLLEGFKLIKNKTYNNVVLEQEKVIEETSNLRFSYGRLKTLGGIINSSFKFLLDIVSFAMIAYLLYKDKITVGTAVATLGYVNSFVSPIQSIMYDVNMMNSTKSIKDRLFPLLRKEEHNEIIKSNFDNEIEFNDVSIRYDNFSLNNFSYKFEKGKKYAIVGKSGSGKSTIINSIMKYTDITSGEILLDGQAVKKYDLSELIYCISQSDHVFSSSFKDNVTVFSSYKFIDFTKIKDALEKKARDKILSSENCTLLSGGEKQVVSIIRMFLSDSPIWIMDEIFSATDMGLTQRLRDVILSVEDKTMIMITHKLSDELSNFDEVLVIENGRLVNSGTYEDIKSSNEFIKIKEIV